MEDCSDPALSASIKNGAAAPPDTEESESELFKLEDEDAIIVLAVQTADTWSQLLQLQYGNDNL